MGQFVLLFGFLWVDRLPTCCVFSGESVFLQSLLALTWFSRGGGQSNQTTMTVVEKKSTVVVISRPCSQSQFSDCFSFTLLAPFVLDRTLFLQWFLHTIPLERHLWCCHLPAATEAFFASPPSAGIKDWVLWGGATCSLLPCESF